MKRQKKSLFRMLTSTALAAVLCVSMAVPAFAADVATGTPGTPASAEITKDLTMPDGTATPGATFTFEVDAVDKDGDTTATIPAITNPIITYTAGEAATGTAGGVKTVTKTADILGSTTYTAAGVYTYTIHESSPAWAGTNETMTYSPANYTMRVYVENDTRTGHEGDVFVAAIGFDVNTVDNSGQTTGKVDYVGGAKILFTNTFSKNAVVVPPASGGAASISKTVTGAYGDQTRYFPFSVTVTAPSVGASTGPYKAYVVENGSVVTAAANYAGTIQTDGNGDDYIEMTSASAETINLKHGQMLAFSDVPTGATYQAVETTATGYTTTIQTVEGGGTPNAITGLDTGVLTVKDGGANTADYTNAYQTVTPTGVLINNLPFLMILVLAAGALVTFVVVKSRKRAAGN